MSENYQENESRKLSDSLLISNQKKNSRTGFISKLYRLVSDKCYDSVVSWNDDKDAFIIQNTHLFENRVLPLYFNHSKMASFERQMNFYGYAYFFLNFWISYSLTYKCYRFHKMRPGDAKPTGKRLKRDEAVKFKHPLFQMGLEHKAIHIKRKTCPKQDAKIKKRVTEMRRKVARLHSYNYTLKKQLKNMTIQYIVESNR